MSVERSSTFSLTEECLVDVEREIIAQRPSRIPISTRRRSPSPPIVIYKKAQHRSLDDLRWYCLARKFSILWQKSTFGCHLRRIKSFYHEKLLRQYFLLWKETIDEEKNQEQATEYYHQQLLRRTFHNWWTVIVQKRQESHLALEHLHRKRLQTTWQLWKTQFAKRRLRQRQFNMANEQYHRGVIGRVSFVLHSTVVYQLTSLSFRSSIIVGKQTPLNVNTNERKLFALLIIVGFICKESAFKLG